MNNNKLMNHLPLIIKREYLTKIKNKSFVIMTFLSPLIFIIFISVVSYLAQLNKDTVRSVYVLDESGVLSPVFKNSKNTTYHLLDGVTLNDAKKLVKEASAYGLLHIEAFLNGTGKLKKITFYSKDSPAFGLISSLENDIQTKLTLQNRIKQGIDVKKLAASKVNVEIIQESFKGEKTSKADNVVKLVFGGAAGYLLFMFIIIYGNMIMRSVIEEKTSRIIEVIISSVKPIQLMLGKIIGTSLAGITQFVIWIILGSVLITLVSLFLGVDMSQMQTPQEQAISQAMNNPELNLQVQNIALAFYNLPLANLIIAFVLFFIGGYLLYSSFYAAIGAAVDSETDTQQFMLPIIIPLILAVYIGVFTVIEDPHGTISTVFSFIPLTAPVVMLMRIPFGVPVWQQIVSLLILLSTFVFTVWFAAKIYRVGILMYGKKTSYKELLKWIKY